VIGEDTAAILLEREDGLPVVVEGALAAAGYPPRAGDRLEIMGTRCSLVLEDARLRLFGAESEEIVFDEAAVRQQSFDDAFAHFVAAIRGERPFWTSASDQLHTLKLVEDAYRLGGAPRRIA
jgi:predicted dehydrogenase